MPHFRLLLSFIFVNHLEKGFRVYQCPFGFGHEIRQILPGLQTNVENVAPRQSQIDHHCQQYSTSKVNWLENLNWTIKK